MGTKNNPGPFDCYAKADPDEPMFVLLGRDPLAPILVRLWIEFRELSCKTDEENKKLNEAVDCAIAMDNWRRRNTVSVTLCLCGHTREQHNILQDYAGPGLSAHPPQFRHCKLCECPAFKLPDM